MNISTQALNIFKAVQFFFVALGIIPSDFNDLPIQVFILAIVEEALIGENEGDCITIDGVCTDFTIVGPQPWVNFTLFAVVPDVDKL